MKIFVAVGTQKFQFNRLLRIMDEVAKNSEYEIFAQTGNSDYKPLNYEFLPFLTIEEFNKRIESSEIVVTHGGVGTIVSALKMSKRIIVVPRLKKYSEHIDDHQLQIAKSFAAQSFIIIYDDNISQMQELIDMAKKIKTKTYKSNREKFISIISLYIEEEKSKE